MSEAWSSRIADRYRCRLSVELADWFDSQIWSRQGHGEFRQAIAPTALLDQAPDAIRPGMMGCDCLPIVSNNAGDWLCVRIGSDNVAAEVIHWYHGGGDWIPWGNQLAEAIAFDAIADRFPSHARRHAIPAESPRSIRSAESKNNDPFTRWALDHLSKSVVSAIQEPTGDDQIARVFLENKVAEVATRCELSISALLRSSADWTQAAVHAAPVTEIAPELAWAWETVGYAAEHQGDLAAAKAAYLRAATCSAFTDQSIRLATHSAANQAAKFAVARLQRLEPAVVQSSAYLSLLSVSDERQRRAAASAFWLADGDQHQQRGDASAAHASFVSAGWDIGAAPIESYGAILERITEAAAESNQIARAEVAATHRRCLRVRFGA